MSAVRGPSLTARWDTFARKRHQSLLVESRSWRRPRPSSLLTPVVRSRARAPVCEWRRRRIASCWRRPPASATRDGRRHRRCPPVDPGHAARGEVSIDPRRQQLIGVRTRRCDARQIAQRSAPSASCGTTKRVRAEINTRTTAGSAICTPTTPASRFARASRCSRCTVRSWSPHRTEYCSRCEDMPAGDRRPGAGVATIASGCVEAARERAAALGFAPRGHPGSSSSAGAPTETVTVRSPVCRRRRGEDRRAGMRVMAGQTLFQGGRPLERVGRGGRLRAGHGRRPRRPAGDGRPSTRSRTRHSRSHDVRLSHRRREDAHRQGAVAVANGAAGSSPGCTHGAADGRRRRWA